MADDPTSISMAIANSIADEWGKDPSPVIAELAIRIRDALLAARKDAETRKDEEWQKAMDSAIEEAEAEWKNQGLRRILCETPKCPPFVEVTPKLAAPPGHIIDENGAVLKKGNAGVTSRGERIWTLKAAEAAKEQA